MSWEGKNLVPRECYHPQDGILARMITSPVSHGGRVRLTPKEALKKERGWIRKTSLDRRLCVFNSGNIIGRRVFIRFVSPEVEKEFDRMEGYKIESGGKVAGIDERGVWFENPNYDMGERDGETGKKILHRLICLVPWHLILSIITFPDFDPEKIPDIGFTKSKPKRK